MHVQCYTTGLRIRSAIVTIVYRKALLLSSSERQTRTLGEITNLTSIDAQRLQGTYDIYIYIYNIYIYVSMCTDTEEECLVRSPIVAVCSALPVAIIL